MLLFVLEVRSLEWIHWATSWFSWSYIPEGSEDVFVFVSSAFSLAHGFLLYAQRQKQCDLSQEVTLKFSYPPFPSLPPSPWHWVHLESSRCYLLSTWLASFFHLPLSSSLTMYHINLRFRKLYCELLGSWQYASWTQILFLLLVSKNPTAWFQLIISAENSPSIFSS